LFFSYLADFFLFYLFLSDSSEFLYKIHIIKLRSRKDTTKFFYIDFTDENNNKDWRIDEIDYYEKEE